MKRLTKRACKSALQLRMVYEVFIIVAGVLKVLSFWLCSPINAVSPVTTISELRIDAAGPGARAPIRTRQRYTWACRRIPPAGRIGTPPLRYTHAHHRRTTKGLTGDHLDTERSLPLPTLRTFLSLLATLTLLSSSLSSHVC